MAKMSARAIWSGTISFGLLSIPVKLFTAIREKNLHFRSLHDQDKMPLKQKMVCSADGKEVHREHIVKGYEVSKDHFVVINQEELDAAAPKTAHSIEIQDFVPLDEIDPLFFDRPYYMMPKPEGAKPYALLVEAMLKTGKVGIAKVVMFNKEYLAAIRPLDGLLVLETMHFDDELVPAKEVTEGGGAASKVDDRELKVAQQLINSLSTKFKPERYHDEYREKVLEIVSKKAAGQHIVVHHEEEPHATRANDLLAALEASIAKAKNHTANVPRPSKRKKAAH